MVPKKTCSTQLIHVIDHDICRTQCANVNKILRQAKLNYYSEKIASFQPDPENLFKVAKHLLEGPDDGIPWTRNSTWRNKLTPSIDLALHSYGKSITSEHT